MYTPHVVTIVNAIEGDDYAMQYNTTVLHGVMLQASKRANVNKSGLVDADAVTLFIPFTVDAGGKTFYGPKEYEALADKSAAWTLKNGGDSSAADCFFIKGEVVPGTDKDGNPLNGPSYSEALDTYDDVYRVTSVDIRDYGSARMQHWQVGGV